jgi:DNA-binding GntR family transcriptional regulator
MGADNGTSQLIDVTNINEKVYQLIKQNIIKFVYPPGYNLNINELKDALGVSPTPIKDALFKLAGEGLVVIYPRKGTYVKNVNDEDIREIIQIRMILETAVVAGIAERITAEQLEILEELHRQASAIPLDRDSDDDYRTFMECDSQFHMSFFLFWGNSRLTGIYRNLNAHMQIASYRLMHQARRKNPGTDKEHEDILIALREHDSVKAEEAIRKHLLRFEKSCLAAAASDTVPATNP